MRKLIRFSAVAFLVWAVTTFAWASFSHVTGATGPAEASGATLDFVAGAITWADPPGVLGTPQRFAARQIHRAANAVERLHRGPERLAARVVDELGHRHRHGRGGHRHTIRLGNVEGPAAVRIPLDELDRARARAEARAVVELERHRSQLDRERSRIDRQRAEMLERIRASRSQIERSVEFRQQARIQEAIERVRNRVAEVEASRDGDLKRDMLRKLREILRDLDRELGEVRIDVITELDGVEREVLEALDLGDLEIRLEDLSHEVEVEGPARIRIGGGGR